LRREAPDKAWQVVREKEALYPGDLLVTGSHGALVSADGEVSLSALSEMTGVSKFPVFETAVVLHEAKDVDLDFTLDRGRVDLISRKKSGAAHVRVHVRDHAAEIILPNLGDRLAIEIYGRWPRGAKFNKDAKPEDGPAIAVIALALKGEIDIKSKTHQVALKAPPGPALLSLTNVGSDIPSPQYVEALPDWAKDGGRPEENEKLKAMGKRFRATIEAKSIQAAVEELVNSDVPEERRVGMLTMAALDDLEGIGKVMRSTKHWDVFDDGVVALRHWIGRGPGQDLKLYNGLVEKVKLKPVQAETIVQLLHSFGTEELAEPETYQMLIDFLQNDLLAIRGLAYWHLERLVPQGKKIGYNPLAPKEERDKAFRAWHELVPAGKMPPKASSSGSGSKGS
jgi:hypothetical protein